MITFFFLGKRGSYTRIIKWFFLSIGLFFWSCVTPPGQGAQVVFPGTGGLVMDQAPDRPAPWILAAWYPAWSAYARNYPLSAVPATQLSHLFYAFASLAEDGTVIEGDPLNDIQRVFGSEPPGLGYHGHFAQLPVLREQYPGLKLIITIGGSGLGPRFAAIAASKEKRQRLVESAMIFIERYGFDGIDLDWEFPTVADRFNLSLLIQELRQVLGQRWLSLSAGATAARLAGLDLPLLGVNLDALNLMAYDFHGPWERQTGHQAALYPDPTDPALRSPWAASRYNVRDAVQEVLRQGFPPQKLVIGCPAYGRAWYVLAADSGGLSDEIQSESESVESGSFYNEGRFQPSVDRKPAGSWQTGTYDFDDLADVSRWPAANRYHDPDTGISWYFDQMTGLFVSFDDEASIRSKAAFTREWGLAGMIFWQLGADQGAVLPQTAAAVFRGGELRFPEDRKDAMIEPTGGTDVTSQF